MVQRQAKMYRCMPKTAKKFPELVFMTISLDDLTAGFADGQTLIIVDGSQQQRLQSLNDLAVIESNCITQVKAIAARGSYRRFVGIGGCAALDVARACAGIADAELLLVPTFLSTSCISVDRSVLRYDGKYRASVTRAPTRVIILDEFLNADNNPTILRAARAGFGDFFAGISAAVDYSYRHGSFSPDEVRELARFYLSASSWVLDRFRGYNRPAMRRLARYSHLSSLMVIQRGDTALSAGGEHKLYYAVMENHLYDPARMPFHGELVAVGTLLAVWAFARRFAQPEWFIRFRAVCARLGLPVDREGLHEVGLSLESLRAGLQIIAETDCFLSATAREVQPEIMLRKVFDEQPS